MTIISPRTLSQFHVFLASPSDMSAERECVRKFFDRYNRHTAHLWNVRFEVIDYENYATIGVGRPQELITSQTLARFKDSLALVIGIMAQRFGSPTGAAESGTEEEFNWAIESHIKRGFPEIKWFFRRIETLQFPTDPASIVEAAAQWEKVRDFRQRMKDLSDPVFYTEYLDASGFREVFESDLSQWLADEARPWVPKGITLGTLAQARIAQRGRKDHHHPRSDMELLVDKLEVCREREGEIDLCAYHCDRFEVQLFEQPNRDGEIDLPGNRVRLEPVPSLLRLFQQMQMKTEVAGHWGLMKTHRDWIVRRLTRKIYTQIQKSKEPIRIMQAGIASHVHYFANIRIISEAAEAAEKSVESGRNNKLGISLDTYDLCVGPIAAIRELLALLREFKQPRRMVRNRRPLGEFICSGNVVKLYPSFWDMFTSLEIVGKPISHRLAVRDLAEKDALVEEAGRYDVVVAHQLFTFWHTDEAEKLRGFCRNIRQVAAPQAHFFIGFTPGTDPHRLSLADYENILGQEGFRIEQRVRTWDIYDLDYNTRDYFVRNHEPLVIDKRFVLLWLSLAD